MVNLEEFFFKNRYLLLVLLVGLIFAGLGVFYFKNGGSQNSDKVEVLNAVTKEQDAASDVVVEISGAVENPGVYKLPLDARVEDLLIVAGGLSSGADRDWVAKNINRAAKLSDGQKVYIFAKGLAPATLDRGGGVVQSSLINVNTADAKTLDTLPGIGPVYAQNIIEHRPYSSALELVSKGGIPQNVYEKIKEKITLY
ncbi:hypothetical protein COY30_00815 [Candidatus Woesebacteria bacterium CG_4_10_14_0_2_um_filter_44_9]|uniref:Soluble ligand binding domain-containing protein n=2 Tax=Candidatus Woeseibacteriota TaxID=1752722 RepID=A0A2H0BI59_9BACT|nr:MAG: hypothetical protein COX04_00260 [Candidatus Woesebacteria bacterium CG22_combo_CG10-13_8_21_14_all_45_10]PIZ45999.1 MAG: hypothetical protein COY30_00815 [Candidatus Woesebacteria bacterium CG_4_10_14_0_2_um_filter_44_9]